jgi:hypothetical protein
MQRTWVRQRGATQLHSIVQTTTLEYDYDPMSGGEFIGECDLLQVGDGQRGREAAVDCWAAGTDEANL